jgi:hypothetical protein
MIALMIFMPFYIIFILQSKTFMPFCELPSLMFVWFLQKNAPDEKYQFDYQFQWYYIKL